MKNILLFFCMLLYVPIKSQSIPKLADELLQAYTAQNKFSRSVLIALKDQVVFNKGYGYADREGKLPVSTQTQFRAGSLTKMFTSTLILKLVQQRKLALSDLVSKYVPGFPNGEKNQPV